MTTTKAEFRDLAAELIGSEFAEFSESVVINQLDTFEYEDQASAILNTATIDMIPYGYKLSQFDGEKVKVGDYMLIGQYQLIGFEPSPDNCQVIVAGKEVNLRLVEIDPAQASVILHVRPQ